MSSIINIYYNYVFLFDKNPYYFIKLLYDDWAIRITIRRFYYFILDKILEIEEKLDLDFVLIQETPIKIRNILKSAFDKLYENEYKGITEEEESEIIDELYSINYKLKKHIFNGKNYSFFNYLKSYIDNSISQKESMLELKSNENSKNNKEIKNKSLLERIAHLKHELEKEKNEKKNLKEKIIELEKNKISKDLLCENILEKDKKIKELEIKLSRFPFELSEGEKLISIIFISIDQKMHYSIVCKDTDNFNKIELKLYEHYPSYSETENFFTVNGNIINRFKNIKENNIHDNDIIIINELDK